jgi:hypothetical protein
MRSKSSLPFVCPTACVNLGMSAWQGWHVSDVKLIRAGFCTDWRMQACRSCSDDSSVIVARKRLHRAQNDDIGCW